MEVILKQDVKNLGEKDDIVKVKNGYGLNYLIPQGFASLATPAMKKMHAETQKQRTFKEGLRKAELTKIAENIKALTIRIPVKVGDNGKIFGSVSNAQVAEALAKMGQNIDRKHITLTEEHIKALGTYSAELALHREVKATISFDVVAE